MDFEQTLRVYEPADDMRPVTAIATHHPNPHDRPPFWVEFVLFLIGGYFAGVASILTCDQTESSWLLGWIFDLSMLRP